MSYIALYREWRPLVFKDVVEQQHVVKTLQHSVSSGRIGHAYLFCGTRGTGKTSIAHILSRAINCLSPIDGDPCNRCEICTEILSGSSVDVYEIDAASNNSVDNVREIRDEVIYSPSKSRYKVYIIDEVHMLSTGAFNALLKTLEEPPSHVVFILATTEPHKLPATILSRCQRFDFRRITVDNIIGRLNEIAQSNGIILENDAAKLIARMSDGALRDGISLLDQCISTGNTSIKYEDVLTIVGLVNDSFVGEMVESLFSSNISAVLEKVELLVMDGKDIVNFVSDFVLYFRNMLICQVTQNPGDLLEVTRESLDMLKKQSALVSSEKIIEIIRELSSLESMLKWAVNPRIMLEVTLIKLAGIETSGTSVTASPKPVKQSPVSFAAPIPAVSYSSVSAQPKQSESQNSPERSDDSQKKQYINNWQDFIKNLKDSGRMKLYSFLFDTKAVMLEANIIGIIFTQSSRISRELVAKTEHMEPLEEAAGRFFGSKMKIKCLDKDVVPAAKASSLTSEKPKDEYMDKLLDIAERTGVPFKVFDE